MTVRPDRAPVACPVTMRRTITLAAAALLTLAACGSDDDSSDDTVATEATGDEASTDDTAADGDAADDPTPDEETAEEAVTSADKPDVEIPAEIPTELVRTVLVEGTGDAAEEGDTVIVDYVGVRSSDGVEFDNSYDRGEPFPVTLGSGSVIQGWEDGLVGAQVGERVQLDIPGDLAYGDQARGELIGADEALTFVIDVHAVVPATDAAEQPTEAGVPASEGATELTTVDLVDGEGPTLEAGDTAVLHLVLFRGDNLVAIDTTWDTEPIQIPIVDGQFPAIVEGMVGMQVGGRRAIIAPPDMAFGEEGNPQMGLPAGTDTILVVDLLGVY